MPPGCSADAPSAAAVPASAAAVNIGIRSRRPGNCEGIAGNRYVGAFRPVGCCPAVRARHDVLAVPADVGARLTAISYEQAERKRDAAQAALGYLRRPQTVALRGCWWFRRHQARTGRKLSGSGFRGHRRNC